MKTAIRNFTILFAVTALIITTSCSFGIAKFYITPNEFEYQEVSAPNPMKGFVALYESPSEEFSLEYVGIKFNDIYNYDGNVGSINTDYLDEVLSNVASRGNTAILRTYILYPGYNNGTDTGLYLPESIYNELKANGDIYSNTYGGYKLEYPDFNSPELMEYITDFITKFGEKYDGNPAVATVQLGVYGAWGEWNMSGCDEKKCAMTNENMSRLLRAYTDAFSVTKLMARNPSLGSASKYSVGFHDDNFLFNTSDFHKQSAEWTALLKKLDPSYGTLQQFYDFMDGNGGNYESIWNKWETQMFGGELSGMMYEDCFGSIFEGIEREALDYSIAQFHVTWLMGMGKSGLPERGTSEYEKYLEVERSFGYEIGITEVESKDRTGRITVSLTNYGIAPFYYDWTLEYSVIDEKGEVAYTCRDDNFKLSELLPDGYAQSEIFLPDNINRGEYSITLRFVNPAEEISMNAKPINLANNNMTSAGRYEIAKLTVK